jgi:ketosteroid isomerase-like protein
MSVDLSRRLLIAATGVAALSVRAEAEPSAELGSILGQYADALRAEDAEAAVGLFSADGSYMAPAARAAVGRDALLATHKRLLATVRIDLAYDVREAEKFAEVGWLRSTAKVHLKVLSSGVEGTSYANQLVVFGPEAGVWKIRSYLSAPAPAEAAR